MKKNDNYSIVKFHIEKTYPDFTTFYSDTKDVIFRKILSVFEDLVTSENDKTRLIIIANVEKFEFDSNFFFEKSDPEILCRLINPYFETNEDYETCAKVIDVYNNLKQINN